MDSSTLVAAFLASLPPRRSAEVPEDARLAEQLRAMIDHARAAWPDVNVEDATFVRYVAARAADAQLDDMHTDDLYLACACAAGDPAAMGVFDRACLSPLDRPLCAAGASGAILDDVRQIVRARLLVTAEGRRGIEQFQGRGDIRGWVRVAAVREVVRARARTHLEVLVDDDTLLDRLSARDDPERAQLRAQYLGQLRDVFRAALARLSPRDRNLLRLHFIDGLSIDAIGELHDVHRATAARWLVKAERLLQKHVRRDLKEHLSMSTAELASMWQAIESRLDVSIESLLRSSKQAGLG